MSEPIQKLLQDLSKAVAEAMAESSDCQKAIQRIHREGLSLYLAVDTKTHQGAQTLIEVGPQAAPVGISADSSLHSSSPNPAFRLDSRDMAFLESVGIDTTRSTKRRR
ncbi:MAG: hypothetical protein AAF725_27130 [Acidobacteriota bacterium]